MRFSAPECRTGVRASSLIGGCTVERSAFERAFRSSRALAWLAVVAGSIVGCGAPKCTPPPGGGAGAWPHELRELRLPGELVERLAVAPDGALCAAVRQADATLDVGCFTGCAFERITSIPPVARGAQRLVVNDNRDVALVVGSCLVSVPHGGEPVVACTDAPVFLEDADVDFASGRSLASVSSRDTSDVLLGDILVRANIQYLVADLPLAQDSQLHWLSGYAQPPSVIASDGRGGWIVAGDYLSTATAPEWALPDGGGPFWMRLDATLAPTSSRAYDGAGSARWALDPDGVILGLLSRDEHTLVSETAPSPVSIGRGGYIAELAVGRDTIVVVGGFDRFSPAPVVFGAVSTSSTETRDFVASLDRAGIARWLGVMPDQGTNPVVLDDGSIAIGAADTIHVLAGP